MSSPGRVGDWGLKEWAWCWVLAAAWALGLGGRWPWCSGCVQGVICCSCQLLRAGAGHSVCGWLAQEALLALPPLGRGQGAVPQCCATACPGLGWPAWVASDSPCPLDRVGDRTLVDGPVLFPSPTSARALLPELRVWQQLQQQLCFSPGLPAGKWACTCPCWTCPRRHCELREAGAQSAPGGKAGDRCP